MRDLGRTLVLLVLACMATNAFALDIPNFVQEMSAYGDRSTGSKGAEAAADRIEDFFRSALPEAKIGRMRYRVPVRTHGGTSLMLDGRSLPAVPFYANAVSPGTTPAEGLSGPAIYVGAGRLKDFNGLSVNGSIVFMDLDSYKNWMHAAMLGAKALVYVDNSENSPSPRSLYEDKLEPNPLAFPRLMLAREDFQRAFGPDAKPRELADEAVLISSVVWKNIVAENIYAYVKGSDESLEEDIVMLEASYDGTSSLPGRAPAASEAASIAALLTTAEALGAHAPKRSTLLLATSGHGEAQAGLREFLTIYKESSRNLRKRKRELDDRLEAAEKTLELVQRPEPLTADNEEDARRIAEAYGDRIKSAVEALSNRLAELRLAVGLEGDAEASERIAALADRRMDLRRLSLLQTFEDINDEQRQSLLAMTADVIQAAKRRLADAGHSVADLKSGMKLRKLVRGKNVKAMASLHLSDKGDGIGGFTYGYHYDLRARIDRVRAYGDIEDALNEAAEAVGLDEKSGGIYRDTLRPNRLQPWRNFFPSKPALGGEIAAMAGLPGFTLATTNDARPYLGTPYDTPDRIDFSALEEQVQAASRLARSLTDADLPRDASGRTGISRLTGQAKFLRQGELFPDKGAEGTLVAAYQGPSTLYAMVDSFGEFHVAGLADRKHTVHKAVLESYRIDENTGRIIWAVDKRLTGKPAYRVKMFRRAMETELIMFSCAETTLFSTLEPRTLKHMYRIDLIDARNDATPLRYWYGRLDTWRSSLTSVYLEPAARLKLSLSDTLLSRKMLLVNADEDKPEGRGYHAAAHPVLTNTDYKAARDMWTLLLPRVTNLEKHGIFNDRINAMRDGGLKSLSLAEEALAALEYDAFMEEARRALALASRVYNDIDKTQRDVLLGVLFYVALFVPFAYCAERLLFNFTDIHKRIIGFLGILLTVIGVIYFVHPAFRLTYSPTVVILAFFIVGLSVLVSLIIFFRFEAEMRELQRRSKQLKPGGIGKFQAVAAAFTIGVTNLRRRRIRTVLTCATLIILTFTIMNFTAVKSVRERGRQAFGDTASYTGLMMRTLAWSDLPPESLATIPNAATELGRITPRVWYELDDRSENVVVFLSHKGKSAQAAGIAGFGPREPEISGLDRILTRGRWFNSDAENAVLLPRGIAEQLAVTPGDSVNLWGMDFSVVGLFDGQALMDFADLDGEPPTPVTFPSEAGVEVSEVEAEAQAESGDVGSFMSRYQHTAGEQTILLPAKTLLSLGGKIKSFAVKPDENVGLRKAAETLTERFGLMLFSGGPEGTSLYFAADTLDYSGVPNIIVPLAISVLIVLNTMIGSVYERKGEIGVYTSIGLAPTHVSYLFIAEALAFAVLSVVIGYLLAQTAAGWLAGTVLWQGMTANYSSLAGVAAMVLVIVVVLLSVIYPSKVAANIAIPDVNKSWDMPEPEGDQVVVTLPFLIKRSEQDCAGGYLLDYYRSHLDVSHGRFSTGDVGFQYACPIGRPKLADEECFNMAMRVWMAPFDFGVRQNVNVNLCPAQSYPGFLEVQVTLVREAGEKVVWGRLTKLFLQDLRKQLLIWRSLDDPARRMYEELIEGERNNNNNIINSEAAQA